MAVIQLANAPCSWGAIEFTGSTAGRIGYRQMLDELQATGYRGTELGDWGFMPTEPEALRAELTARSLTLIGAFVGVALRHASAHADGIAQAVRTAQLLAAVADRADGWRPLLILSDDCGREPHRSARAGRITLADGLSAAEWAVFAAGTEAIARAVHDATGLTTAFHPHCAGYIETPAEIEQLLARTDPVLVGLVFDTAHYLYGSSCLAGDRRVPAAGEGANVANGGGPTIGEAASMAGEGVLAVRETASAAEDTAALAGRVVIDGLERFHDRLRLVHFKDCSPAIAARAAQESWEYNQAVGQGLFCELGRGAVDFAAVLAWLHQHDYRGWIVVEQDVLPGMGTPQESAARNRAFLAGLGL